MNTTATRTARLTVLRTTAVAAALAAAGSLGVGLAHADTTATVAAATQKMSAPNLGSSQSGTYPKGSSVTLTCYTRGQSVKGAFSQWHANGGWDDLWYQTSDGVYVADIDIQSGSNDPVTGPCTPTAAPAQQAQQAQAPSSSGRTTGHTGQVNVIAAAGYAGQCTDGAQQMIMSNAGYYIPALRGNAKDWPAGGNALQSIRQWVAFNLALGLVIVVMLRLPL